ncbi:MAG: toll/interleukin-1 receptor domain-containing protein [Anaerolineae bacterium]|nr:toll/interleukin-1 receptor domain-containing protein [Anaerolineae bacterium]
MAQYDVFVSYNGDDREWAEQFASELRELGVRVWFDQWELRAGQTWMDELETAIQESASVTILVGQSGLGPWEKVELRQALNNLVQHRCPVIPVILPGVEHFELPPFLKQCQYVDYRDRQTYLRRMEKLVLGVTGRKLTHAISQVGDTFRLEVPGKGQSIFVHTLPNPNPYERLHLSWETFGQGIEYLRDQILNYEQRLPADVCIAINDAGLTIASFLSGSIMHRCKIGYIKTEGTPEGGGRRIIEVDSWLPELSPAQSSEALEQFSVPLILLVDSEIKSGSGLKTVVEKLRTKYADVRICFAVLAALADGHDPKIASFDQLVAKDVLQELNLSAIFIAYTITRPGIEPPLEVR